MTSRQPAVPEQAVPRLAPPLDYVLQYDGLDAAELRRLTGAARVELFSSVPTVLDVAHELAAAGAPQGLLVLADEQTAGRGRQGRAWHSPAGAGVWVAALLRPEEPPSEGRWEAAGALAIRAGLGLVAVVEEVVPDAAPRLKWPNDLMVRDRKAGGVLCEARWNGARLGWVVVGVGINVRGPVAAEVRQSAIALAEVAPAVTRAALLAALGVRLWSLASRPPSLDEGEREAFRRLHWMGPDAGPVPLGVDGEGALLVRRPDGSLDRRIVPV